MVVELRIDDVIRLAKAHPCGSNEWLVTKLGMDIGLSCLGCGHSIRIMRTKLNDSFREFIKRGPV